jgi:hypothetical protein
MTVVRRLERGSATLMSSAGWVASAGLFGGSVGAAGVVEVCSDNQQGRVHEQVSAASDVRWCGVHR